MNNTKVIPNKNDDTIRTKKTVIPKILKTTTAKYRKEPRRKLQIIREMISKKLFINSFLKNRKSKSDINASSSIMTSSGDECSKLTLLSELAL
mmetsp:Transcript_36766/g.41914  ORF Transcript_36766/g.41914 Transcript_36766/m.41914 type:complete len:93 (+) Transcript_36766:1-279(+)